MHSSLNKFPNLKVTIEFPTVCIEKFFFMIDSINGSTSGSKKQMIIIAIRIYNGIFAMHIIPQIPDNIAKIEPYLSLAYLKLLIPIFILDSFLLADNNPSYVSNPAKKVI